MIVQPYREIPTMVDPPLPVEIEEDEGPGMYGTDRLTVRVDA